MNSIKISDNYAGKSSEVSAPPVIQMNSSEIIFHSAPPAFYQQLLRTLSHRTTKLAAFFPLDRSAWRLCKRAVDVLISFVVIVAVLSWLMPIIALLIKLDSKGPVFFTQKRTGRGNQLFTCIKFRSMVVNTESDLRAATDNDERITRLGKFLRNHYLDELPQFFNVLLGDMSVIGPRPHMITDNLKYEETIGFYDFRHKAKPGITGLAQVLGFSGPVDDIQKMKDRVQLDIFYIRHWSFKLDLVILFRTLLKVFSF